MHSLQVSQCEKERRTLSPGETVVTAEPVEMTTPAPVRGLLVIDRDGKVPVSAP